MFGVTKKNCGEVCCWNTQTLWLKIKEYASKSTYSELDKTWIDGGQNGARFGEVLLQPGWSPHLLQCPGAVRDHLGRLQAECGQLERPQVECDKSASPAEKENRSG